MVEHYIEYKTEMTRNGQRKLGWTMSGDGKQLDIDVTIGDGVVDTNDGEGVGAVADAPKDEAVVHAEDEEGVEAYSEETSGYYG